MIEQAEDALQRARELRDLHASYRERLQAADGSANAFRLVDELFIGPVVSRPMVAEDLSLTYAGAGLVVGKLIEVGILEPMAETRPQLYQAEELLEILQR